MGEPARGDKLVPPLAIFIAFYVATMLAGFRLRVLEAQWVALAAGIVATIAVITLWEHGHWSLGFRAPLARVLIESGAGVVFAVCLIGAADLLIILTTGLQHQAGRGFPTRELMLVFIPAVLHEELVFRGYSFQKLWHWRRNTAIVIVSLLFAALHLGNDGVSVLGIVNVFLGGVLLSLAYERYERLWFPIGIHLGWNIMSGPIFGYGVSGYTAEETVLRTSGTGAALLTGGTFGIEGSVWMTVMEMAAIVVLARRRPTPNGIHPSPFNIQHSAPVSQEPDQ